jgi:hypothetical protein
MGPGNRRRKITDKIPHREDDGLPSKSGSIGTWSTQFLALLANKNTAARLFLYFSIPHSGAKASRFKSKTFQVVSGSILVRQMQRCTRPLMRYLSLLRPNVHCSALILVALLTMRES